MIESATIAGTAGAMIAESGDTLLRIALNTSGDTVDILTRQDTQKIVKQEALEALQKAETFEPDVKRAQDQQAQIIIGILHLHAAEQVNSEQSKLFFLRRRRLRLFVDALQNILNLKLSAQYGLNCQA